MTERLPSDHVRVLVVEDEPLTRMSAVTMLLEAGYDVVEADNGTAALLMLEGVGGIRVMLTDLDMPAGLDGVALAACVDLRWPHIGVIMTSGTVKPLPGDVPKRARFLPKPYASEDMLAIIAGMIGPDELSSRSPG